MWNQIGERTGCKGRVRDRQLLRPVRHAGNRPRRHHLQPDHHHRRAQGQVRLLQPYVYDGAQIVVRKGNNTIHGIKDLEGKKVAVNLGSNFEELLRKNDPNKKIDIRTYDSAFQQGCRPGPHRRLRDGPRLHRPADPKESKLPLQQAGAPFETIENALPFLKTPEKQAVLKKVDDALTAMRKDGTPTR